MSKKPPKSPQEKKALSLKKDCRNTYGNNQKAARKAIPLRKAKESRKVRHKNNQALSAVERLDDASLDIAESTARQNVDRLGGWAKWSDEPLGVVIERQALAREHRFGRKLRSQFRYSSDS